MKTGEIVNGLLLDIPVIKDILALISEKRSIIRGYHGITSAMVLLYLIGLELFNSFTIKMLNSTSSVFFVRRLTHTHYNRDQEGNDQKWMTDERMQYLHPGYC